MDKPDNVITILEARVEEAQEHLKKLARKAQRYGTPRISWTLGEVREEERQDSNGRLAKVQYRDIILNELEAPRVGDFQFIARLEHTDAGTIIDSIPGEELPKRFRSATRECEHCKHDRQRKHLFVVRDPEGNLVQVGRTCLRDYMGTDSPASVAARFRWERELSEWSDEWGGRGGVIQDSAEELLAVTSTAIRLWGVGAQERPGERRPADSVQDQRLVLPPPAGQKRAGGPGRPAGRNLRQRLGDGPRGPGLGRERGGG